MPSARPRRPLASLLKTSPKKFLASHWGQKPFHGRADAKTLRFLEQELLGCDVPSLVARSGGRTQVWFEDLDGGYRWVDGVSGAGALRLYDAGMTVYLHQAHTAELLAWHRDLAREIGHPESNVILSVFAARRGARTPYHFDKLENLTIQLRGKKRWWLAPNRHVEQPTQNWAAGQAIDPELQLYMQSPFPASMPEGAQEIELKAGDVLYLPRGYWHTTDASGDSFSVFVGFRDAPWTDLVVEALRARLLQHVDWRENVIGDWTTPTRRRAARRKLAALLEHVAEEARALDVDEVAPELRERGDGRHLFGKPLRKNPLAAVLAPLVEGRSTDSEAVPVKVFLHRKTLGAEKTIAVERRALGICHWIVERRGPFEVDDVVKAFPKLGAPLVRSTLTALLDAGALLEVDA